MNKIGKLMGCMVAASIIMMNISAFHIAGETTSSNTIPQANNPPSKPTLEGPQMGMPNSPYSYTACATDPDGDRIFYTYDWGDGCQMTMSCCFASGESCTACYCWSETGIYNVRVCASDCYHCYGEWSDPLPVNMPYNHQNIWGLILELILQLFGIAIS
jgi:hypothetical protein